MPRGYLRRRYRRRGYGGRRRVVRRLLRRVARKVGRYSRIASTLRTGGWGRLNPGKAEKKYLDIGLAAQTVDGAAGSGVLLNGISQNSSVTGRVGSKITIKSIQWWIAGGYTNDGVNPFPTGIHIDAKIVCDTQCNGTIMAKSDVNSGIGAPTQLNLDNRRRFIVIKHKTWQLAGGTATITPIKSAPSTFMWKGYKRMNMDIIYKGTGNSISDIASNSLGFLIQSNVPGGQNTVNYDALFRIRYTDT